jgi:hypothetical protein
MAVKNPNNLQNKTKIYILLSEFYLDTELDENSIKRIITDLVKEDLSLTEILEINKKEVYPVLAYNLISVAGIWQGFEEENLIKEINKYSKKTRWGKFIQNLPLLFHYSLEKAIEKEIRINFNKYQ